MGRIWARESRQAGLRDDQHRRNRYRSRSSFSFFNA
jgi:hypothetical protein